MSSIAGRNIYCIDRHRIEYVIAFITSLLHRDEQSLNIQTITNSGRANHTLDEPQPDLEAINSLHGSSREATSERRPHKY